MIRLTEEEINGRNAQAVAKAQLKKVVEWIKTEQDKITKDTTMLMAIPDESWQTLLKEVEDETRST